VQAKGEDLIFKDLAERLVSLLLSLSNCRLVEENSPLYSVT